MFGMAGIRGIGMDGNGGIGTGSGNGNGGKGIGPGLGLGLGSRTDLSGSLPFLGTSGSLFNSKVTIKNTDRFIQPPQWRCTR